MVIRLTAAQAALLGIGEPIAKAAYARWPKMMCAICGKRITKKQSAKVLPPPPEHFTCRAEKREEGGTG